MKKAILKLSYLIAIVFMLSACYPGGAEYTSDTDIILTSYNDQFDFGTVKTYYMSDSIQHIVEEDQEPDRTFDAFILGELERNFEARGYQRLFPEDTLTEPAPDVMVVVRQIEVTTTSVWGGYPWYGGWGWGWGWYKKGTSSKYYWGYPGYGWGYPYYPTYVTSYTTGTVAWTLFDPENVDEDNELVYLEWAAAINGLLGSGTSTTKSRITNSINQAFTQSSYIQSN